VQSSSNRNENGTRFRWRNKWTGKVFLSSGYRGEFVAYWFIENFGTETNPSRSLLKEKRLHKLHSASER
jgi:hypothetical protein